MLHKNSLLIAVYLIFSTLHSFAQTPSQADAKAMAERIKHMTPSQMMQWRDSMTNAVMHHEAAVLPNGDQLLIKHKYDTGYVTVSFQYSKKYSGPGGSSTDMATGFSTKAPMLYEANGHTIVGCSMKPFTSNTGSLNRVIDTMGQNGDLKTREQDQRDVAFARQFAFSSMIASDKSMMGTGTHSYKKETVKTVDNIMFSFEYDPVQNISTVGAGADVTVAYRCDKCKEDTYGPYGIGCSASTDPSLARIVGAAHVARDPKGSYAMVSKTKAGFRISFNKTTHYDKGGTVVETLTATIGEDDEQYEAVIVPFQCQYEIWLPKGPKVDGSDDTKGDDSMRFNVVVYEKGNQAKQYPGTYSAVWRLSDISHYKGFCSNYPGPVNNPNENADLKFSDSLKTDKYFKAEGANDSTVFTKDSQGNFATARIMSMDYAAWGHLSAHVILDNGQELIAHPYYTDNMDYLVIPFDRDENKLADEWEKRKNILHGGYPLDWDEDKLPKNGNNGDDISLFDEYRGFAVDSVLKTVFTRTDPQTKDVFACVADFSTNSPTVLQEGAALYGKASGITSHTIGCNAGSFACLGSATGHNSAYLSCINFNTNLSHHTFALPVYFSPAVSPFSEGNTKCLDNISEANGAYVPADVDYINIFEQRIRDTVILPKATWLWYQPTPTSPYGGMMRHLRHIIPRFSYAIDTVHFGANILLNQVPIINKYMVFTVAHEMGHATNITHHHLEKGNDGAYYGQDNCLMRYFVDCDPADNLTDADCSGRIDRFEALLSNIWNPASGLWPDGTKISFCKTEDDCWSELTLKKK